MRKTVLALVATAVCMAITAGTAAASHSWGGYHWARTSNPFTVQLGDNVSGPWDSMFRTASTDWSKSRVLDTSIVAGGTTAKRCSPTLGRVEVCSYNYGGVQWLGVASIWLASGSTHIVQGTVKNNDFYFGGNSHYDYAYNNTAQMQHVICQEIGHTFGLDHQDESGISLNTCMDYYHNTSASDTKSTHLNAHDYEELEIIYNHLDSTTTIGRAAFSPFGTTTRTSKVVAHLAGGARLITYTTWAGF